MIIPYSKKSDKREMALGLAYMVIGIGSVFFQIEIYLSYLFIFTGVLYFASVLYRKKYPYLKVDNDILKMSGVIPKQINLSKIVKIKEFAGDYTLITPSKKLKIDYVLIDESAKQEFKNFIDSMHFDIEHSTKKVSSFKSL